MATSEYIRLTPDQQSKTGGLWSRVVSNQTRFSSKYSAVAHYFSMVGAAISLQNSRLRQVNRG